MMSEVGMIYIIISLMIVMLPLFVIVFVMWSVYGTRFLYFDTNKTARMIRKRKLDENGAVKIQGKKFSIKGAKPIIYKRPVGVSSMYILRHDSTTPLEFNSGGFGPPNISPAELQELTKLTEMKAMLNKQKRDTGFIIILSVVGFMMGFLMCFVFFAAKIIALG
jgi:hypothetical protein